MSFRSNSRVSFSQGQHGLPIRWLALVYYNPEAGHEVFANLPSRKESARLAVAILLIASLSLILLLALCHVFVFGVLHLPYIEPVEPAFLSRIPWHTSEIVELYLVSVGCAFAVLTILKLVRVKFVNNVTTMATVAVGGTSFGLAACTAHAVAGGARGLTTVIGIAVISCCTIVGAKFGLEYQNKLLAFWVGLWLTVAGAVGFYVISSLLGGTSIELAGGPAGAATLGGAAGIAFGFSTSSAHGRQLNWVTGVYLSGVFGLAGIIAGSFVWGSRHGTVFGLSLTIASVICILRAYYLPIHAAFLWLFHSAPFSRHPAAWDEMCSVPFADLDRLLVSYFSHQPLAAQSEINKLLTGTAQHKQAVRACIRIVVEKASKCANLSELAHIADTHLTGPTNLQSERALLNEISAKQNSVTRAFTSAEKIRAAEALCDRLESFPVDEFPEFIRDEVLHALEHWKAIAERQLERLKGLESIPYLYKYGRAVDHRHDPFVLRTEIRDDLVRQIQDPHGSSGILLYGRRRLGKTTIITNLEPFVPEDLKSVYVSMQNAKAIESLESLLALIVNTISTAVDVIHAPDSLSLSGFQAALAEINRKLESDRHSLVIAIDEIEILDRKFHDASFSIDILGVIREAIRLYRHVVWLFVSSHQFVELRHRMWSSYFIELHTTRVPPFQLKETLALLCDPLHSLPSDVGSSEPVVKFKPAMWGDEKGIDRIHNESGGWPSIIQLIAQVVVDILNNEHREKANDALIEKALEEAVVRGNNLFDEVIRGECFDSDEWSYLQRFARETELDPSPNQRMMESLWRRELLERRDGRYALKVPIVGRWLRRWYPL